MFFNQRIINLFVSFSLVAASTAVFSQTNSISPYSYYHFGDFQPANFTTRGMGGVGVGLPLTNQINFLNPAALSSQDTMSFIFNTSISIRNNAIASATRSGRINQLGLDHLAVSFPLSKGVIMSAGIMPFSQTGYKVSKIGSIDNSTDLARYTFDGSGGLSKVFAGLGVRVLDQLSVGLNAYYMFGEIVHAETAEVLNPDSTQSRGSYASQWTKEFTIRGFGITPAVLYQHAFGARHTLSLGATWDPAFNLTTDISTIENNSGYDPDSSFTEITEKGNSRLPQSFSIGASYTLDSKLTLALDYQLQQWSGASVYSRAENLTDAHFLRFGVAYLPRPEKPKSYFQRITYRAGAHYNTGNLKVDGTLLSAYGLTAGLSLPYKNTKSRFDISYQYTHRGNTQPNNLQEINHWITINISLFDIWFYKQKLD